MAELVDLYPDLNAFLVHKIISPCSKLQLKPEVHAWE